MTQQFYQLTLKDAIADYQDGALSAYGLLKNYFRIKFAPGWKIVINLKNVCAELGLTLNSLYRALKKIKDTSDRTIVIKTEKEYCTSQNKDLTSAKTICKFAKNDLETTNKTKHHSDPPDIRSNKDHISLSNKLEKLPEEEREKFLSFAREQANKLPKPPTLTSAWIAAYFDDLRDRFDQQSKPTNVNDQFVEWYGLMRELGHLTAERTENGVRMVGDSSGYWSTYEYNFLASVPTLNRNGVEIG